jgi:ADP-heptose:LPS heptosyltransferase
MRYEPVAEERAAAARLWQAHDLHRDTTVVMHPSPGAPAKRWTPERFAAVADYLAERYGCRVLLTGARADEPEARAIAAAGRRPPLLLAGQTDFGVLAALLDCARFAVGTDNGAMHLAIARGVPTVRLFGPTDPALWAAWPAAGATRPPGARHPPGVPPPCRAGRPPATGEAPLPVAPQHLVVVSGLACSPCHRLDVPPWDRVAGDGQTTYPCMGDISVDAVLAAVDTLWTQTA